MGLSSFNTSIDTTKSILDYNDKFIVWIVGFAITTITLLIANSSKLSIIVTENSIKITIILLSISLLFGIIFRLLAFTLLRYFSEIIIFIETALSTEYEFPDMDNDDIERINKSNDFNYILSQISDAGGNIPENTIILYRNSDDVNKKILLDSFKSHYADQIVFNKKHFDTAMEFIFDTYRKGLDISESEFHSLMKNGNSVTSKHYRLIDRYLIPYSFFISCISFLIAIGIIITSYLIK